MQQVLAFFSSLMKKLGNNIEFVVQPTLEDGMVVGVSWKLGFPRFYLCSSTSCGCNVNVSDLLLYVSFFPQNGIRFLCLWEKVSASTCAMSTRER